MRKKYNISVDCANCASKMEEEAKKIEGIKSLSINFMTLKMIVEFNENADEKNILKEIEKRCKRIDSDFEFL